MAFPDWGQASKNWAERPDQHSSEQPAESAERSAQDPAEEPVGDQETGSRGNEPGDKGEAVAARENSWRCSMGWKDLCDLAKARYAEIGWLRKCWGRLWIALGAAVSLFLVMLIFSIFLLSVSRSISQGITTAISLLGAVVSGTAMKWITTERKAAVAEDEKALNDVKSLCAPRTKPPLPATPSPGTKGGDGGIRPKALGTEIVDSWFNELKQARESGPAVRAYVAKLRGEETR